MVNALMTFFASFNPFIFGAVFSLGLVSLVRTPDRLIRAASELPRSPTVKSLLRRDS